MGGDELVKIAVDLDDVVVDFFGRVVKCYNKEFSEDVAVSQIKGWDDNPIKKSNHFGEGRMFSSWWSWWESRGLWSDCEAIDGAIGGLYKLHDAGHYIELLTSKPVWARPDLAKWIHEWNPYFDSLTIVEEGAGIVKADVTDAQLLIDDRDKNVQEWVDSDPSRQALLFRQPWNTDYYKELRAKVFGPGVPTRVGFAGQWKHIPSLVEVTELYARG
jgi:5'(3')-deoxyribonucleotidase